MSYVTLNVSSYTIDFETPEEAAKRSSGRPTALKVVRVGRRES